MACAALALSMLAPGKAHSASFYYLFDNSFSGTSPAGPAPWTSILFQDVSPGVVSLSISNNGLTGSEFISELYLNLNTNLNPNQLNISLLNGTLGVSAANILTGVNMFKADGDGKYDIHFGFSTSSAGRFAAGDYLQYTISGIPNLSVTDFDFLSAPAGGHGPFLAATHVQSIGDCSASGWTSPTALTPIEPVPEPSSVVLLGLAVGAWFGIRRSFWRN